ncbi:MAG: FAD-dependent oxidoreductase [Clostridiales bacterium]|nr:FAD-dependent oxidoreductase [Clostridiales bacterium]
MYDAAIVGSGPAGLSAAMNLHLHNKNFIWFGTEGMSAKVVRSEKIANYPGMGLISGDKLNKKFSAHAKEMGLSVTSKMVTNIMAAGESFTLLAENDIYEAGSLILAIGAATGRGITGETELLGRGVSYCATCDGFLYKGKTIAVLCMSKAYEHEAEYLAGMTEKVFLYTPYKDSGIDLGNVTRLGSPIKAVYGKMRVEEIELVSGEHIPVDGLFCLRDSVAPAVLLPGLAMDGPHIMVDRDCATNLPGCFAAGDCTGRPYQIAKAVGEGNVAAHSLLDYLAGN